MMGFYGFEFSRNESEDSDVLAHAVVSDDGRTEAALVSLDVTFADRGVVLAIREHYQLKCGILTGNVFVAANHVHSAPHTAPMFPFGVPPDPRTLRTSTSWCGRPSERWSQRSLVQRNQPG